MQNASIGLGTGTLCIGNGLIQSSYFSVTISALTEPDWAVLQANHAIMVTSNPKSQKNDFVLNTDSFIGLGTGTLCMGNGLIQSSYFSVTISALIELD